VDIALAKDFLSHAFLDNYDVAVLVAGDGNYVPLIIEVKRLGKVVYVVFFHDFGLSTELHSAADMFFEMGQFFLERWQAGNDKANERGEADVQNPEGEATKAVFDHMYRIVMGSLEWRALGRYMNRTHE